MTDRIPLDELTSDAYDALHADLDWARRQALAAQQEGTEAVTRLERTEAERDMLGREAGRLRKNWVEMRTRAEKAEAELTALKAIRSGYCGHCGRGDCSPTAAQWYEQQQRAERAEAAIERVRKALDVISDEWHGGHRADAEDIHTTVRQLRAALDEHQEQ